ncbi:MAG TPA: hypothetical protein VM184_09480 [Gaiellaceae bacterium]|nr:hypothetical protein [Gaiellaceae bacterium]
MQCIDKAFVATTASLAKVEIGTSVPTKVVVTARRLSSTGGLVAGPLDASVSGFLVLKSRTVFLRDLKPGRVVLRSICRSLDGLPRDRADGHTRRLVRQLERLGHRVTLEPAAEAA